MPRDLQTLAIKTFGDELGRRIINHYPTFFQGRYGELSNRQFLKNCRFVAKEIDLAELHDANEGPYGRNV